MTLPDDIAAPLDIDALRSRCAQCPWRDMQWMNDHYPQMVEAAKAGSDNWHCHVRLGPCDGPRHAEVLS